MGKFMVSFQRTILNAAVIFSLASFGVGFSLNGFAQAGGQSALLSPAGPASEGQGWQEGFNFNGPDGQVEAVAVSGSDIFVGGKFASAGGVSANNIARWDGSQWHPLGAGINGEVRALAADGSGNLIAGGEFSQAGGNSAMNIARWNGTAWDTLGNGFTSTSGMPVVNALVFSGGSLYAGGTFASVGGVPANMVARWNGAAWEALGAGITSTSWGGTVVALVFSGTTLYAGGYFDTAGSSPAANIARWTGSVWEALGSGLDSGVHSLAIGPGGSLFVGGGFDKAGGQTAHSIASWNPAAGTWSAVGGGMSGCPTGTIVFTLLYGADNALYAGGTFTASGNVDTNHIAFWSGGQWHALDQGTNHWVTALAEDGSGNLVAGGWFETAGSLAASRMAKWDGKNWSALGGHNSPNGPVYALAVETSGHLVSGGDFKLAGVTGTANVAHLDGSTWQPLQNGIEGWVYSLASYDSLLYAGGHFATASSVSVNHIARWNGAQWEGLAGGMSGDIYADTCVHALAVDSIGKLYAGGSFKNAGSQPAQNIALWNGTGWQALGSGITGPGVGAGVYALAWHDGSLYAGGMFDTAGSVKAANIAKWTGSTWESLGAGVDGIVFALAFDSLGNLYVGGEFLNAGAIPVHGIALWKPAAQHWEALGSGVDSGVMALAVNAGQVYAGGGFSTAGGHPSPNIARWNGSAWLPMSGGVNGTVWSLAVTDGKLWVGGDFTAAGETISQHLARWTPTTLYQVHLPLVRR